MNDLLKVLPIYAVSTLAYIWFNLFNITFMQSKIKSGIYTIPFSDHIYKNVFTFTGAAWCFNAIFCYIWATMMISWCYRESMKLSGGLYYGFFVGQITSMLSAVIFLRLIAGEVPDKNGWITLVFMLIACYFSAKSI